jgi:ATP-dependent DNA helicase RecQ
MLLIAFFSPLTTVRKSILMSSTNHSLKVIRDPHEALEHHFGFREFLSGQEPVVSALLSGQDTLAVMPTGGGKSLCYQLPALVMDGVTLVISPLIALMKDQVDALIKKEVPATLINSTLSLAEQNERLKGVSEGLYKLVYVAPERFRSASFIAALSRVHIALFAVDEAHCLSQWGHDFRPDYVRLGDALEKLGHPQTAAFTATATPDVRADILKHLKLRNPFVSISGFERPNLSLKVVQCAGNREKYERLDNLIERQQTGIVYCSTRKKVEEVYVYLQSCGKKVIAYHGGMDDQERSRAQTVFIEKTCDVAVATNAFGMGIDRSDVRFVAHFDVPGSIEAYYQEAGRAGRDGESAECELYFNYADTRTQEFFIEGNNPGYGTIVDIYSALRQLAVNREVHMTIKEIGEQIGLSNDMQAGSALSHLTKAGYIERFDIPGKRMRGTRIINSALKPEDLVIDHAALGEKERRDRSRLEAMIQFCYGENTCRQAWILNYFGEDDAANCGTCDNCLAGRNTIRRLPLPEEFDIVRKALSGVARCSTHRPDGNWEARFGKGKIVQMLVGGRSQEVLSARMDKLSTYGLLKKQGSAYVFALFDEFQKAGLVTIQKTPFPLLTLTRRGAEVMRGDNQFKIEWPDASHFEKPKSAKATQIPTVTLAELAFDEKLFEKLKQTRAKIAAEAGGIPPHVIFSNQTLEFFTRLRPQTREEAMRIAGVGEVKADRYLAPFLAVIKSHPG